MIHAFPQVVVSSQRLLDYYLDSSSGPLLPASERYAELWRLVFVETRQAFGMQLPDHAYRNAQIRLQAEAPNLMALLLHSLTHLASDHLVVQRRHVHVRADAFERWQNLVTRVTPLPLIAFRFSMEELGQAALWATIEANLSKSTLPCIDSPFIDNVINDSATSELHVHLNGTTETDLVWQHAIERPGQFLRLILKAADRSVVREHYLQIGSQFDETRLYNLLYLAQHLRVLLVEEVFANQAVSLAVVRRLNRQAASAASALGRRGRPGGHPVDPYLPAAAQARTRAEKETFLLASTFEYLRRNPHEGLATALHQYLLIVNSFNRLLVQQVHQKGFDQFQRFTLNETREQAEGDYVARFRQFEGMHGERLAYVEGRFAPKKNARESLRITRRIIRDYERYRGITTPNLFGISPGDMVPRRLELGLVAHFIKRRPDRHDGHHYQTLRGDLMAQARGLVYLADRVPKIRERLKGFDAAANEMHAPPEVFAPAFRYLRRQGFPDFTFHVGEDFVHVLSGLRAVHEAVNFLDLGTGCRIGHGTAVGVRPDVWMARSAPTICVTRGEWLDNLVFAYALLSSAGCASDELHRLQADIAKHFHTVHGLRFSFDHHQFQTAWHLRHHDPDVVLRVLQQHDVLDAAQRREFDAWEEDERVNPVACALHREYLWSQEVSRARAEWIDVAPNYLRSELITCLQSRIIEELNRRTIAIESMPTSNVRIGIYEHYREHHIFRWLGVDRTDVLPRPILVVASDNPGVFSTSVHHELAHVYNTLVRDFDLPHQEALEHLHELNRTGGMFRFKGRA